MKQIILALLVLSSMSFSARINNLYTNQRAMQAGDLLTVMIVENAKAGSNSTTKTGTKSSASLGGGGSGALGFIPEMGGSGNVGSGYEGAGKTTREGTLVATLSVRIDKVYDNGNLLISGNKVVEINEEKEIIRLTGTVRPLDIEANNTIFSYNIANAEITYSGHGEVSDAQRAGPFARFFNWLF